MRPVEPIGTSSLSRVLETPIRDINHLYLLVSYQHVDYKLSSYTHLVYSTQIPLRVVSATA